LLKATSFFHLAGSWQVGEELNPALDVFTYYKLNQIFLKFIL